MLNPQHPAPRKGRTSSDCTAPEVAEAPVTGQHDSNPDYGDTDLATFKVFLKRNLRPQAPPTDLLGKLRARIDEISAAD